MGDRRRLRALGVRMHGEHRCAVHVRQLDSARRSSQVAGGQCQDQLTLAHPVHRHVDVVAAAGRVQAARRLFAARGSNQPVDVEEQVLRSAVVDRPADIGLRDGVERGAERVRIVALTMPRSASITRCA